MEALPTVDDRIAYKQKMRKLKFRPRVDEQRGDVIIERFIPNFGPK